MRTSRLAAALVAVLALILTGCGSGAATATAGDTRTITDMNGRTVEVPATVSRVVTLGAVPVINSFLFALGEGEVIVNGLPDFARNPRWKYQYVFAPQIEQQPVTQSADRQPSTEKILDLKPDVVLTMHKEDAEPLERLGLKVVTLKWRDPEDVTKVVDLLGQVLDQPERARAYTGYFDRSRRQIADALAAVPAADRTSALYLSHKAMTRPHLIAEWWITQAGGRSVTEGSEQESLKLNIEQILAWNPQVIFVSSSAEITAVIEDPRLAGVAAVQNKRVYATPIAAHLWGNRTSEQPLTVLWAAKQLYPDQLAGLDLAGEVSRFYSEIYKTELDNAQVDEILAGL
ncbi:ABC transporter substrate-binding protein [Pseudonocardia asaccharolytica]|uniref:ABC transporter substrate-binding protein n=1 Tax=Pseudonocardia asaccharolytica DSM 44247 = NBRC 16224 TaxID=1123024 RepID=A0A511CYV7_9PSEU|nr:ABC transporter substrate-binding protein [Pseudonocardia asaccharolytica]GEL17716.1 ABC transporter substrate-binding protein [Pseudonocardia asaccharolytica DSM 44247 = NBRC 16224]